MSKKIKFEYFLLSIIVILAFVLRLYRIDAPLADWHSWRQADTAAVSRNFLKFGFDILHPRFDDLSSLPSGQNNPLGYRFVEFPIYNLIHVSLVKFWPVFSLDVWGRLVAIIFSLGSLLFLYFLVKKYLGKTTALLAAFFFAVLPFNIYFSRTILPESMMIFVSLGMIYFFTNWLEKEKLVDYLLLIIFTALVLLSKPFMAFLFIPLIYLLWQKWQLGLFKNRRLYFYVFFSVLPFALWRIWMSQYPEGIPSFSWLFNYDDIRFKGAFFYWLFAERLGKLILGYWGLLPFLIGILVKPKEKEGWFFHWWLVAILVYFIVIAAGNVRHDYYQVIAIPLVCLFLAKGCNFLLRPPPQFSRLITYFLSLITLLAMLAFSWYYVRDFFNINHPEIIEAGKAVDKLVPPNAKVVAPYNGDTAFLYQTNRQGWPAVVPSIDYLLRNGATTYVSVTLTDEMTQRLAQQFKVLKAEKNYIIIDLTSSK